MRSPDATLLNRIRATFMRPTPVEPAPIVQPPRDTGKLQEDLQYVLEAVGKEQYAKATARLFAPGGKYNRGAKKQRYAIT